MRADRKRREKEQARSKRKAKGIKNINIFGVLAVLYALVAAYFLINIVRLNILPMMYLVLLVLAMGVVSFVIIKRLWTHAKEVPQPEKKLRPSSIVAILMIIVLTLGSFYLGGTLNFFGNITGGKQIQNFYVIVNADSEYQKLKDIEGQTVGLMAQESESYTKAQEKLQDKVDVQLEKKGTYDAVAQALINREYEAVYLNSAYYEMAVEEVTGFDTTTTRILEEITVIAEGSENEKSVSVTEDSFNMYVSGIDTAGSIGNISRTDVNMLVTVNPKTRTILLTSIPRDYYVQLGTIGAYDKLTHSGLYGIEETTATIENLFGVDINYYARVNFTTVVNLVDALGGITVNSDYSFVGTGQDGTQYSFYAGLNDLNGEQALAFARERYSFSEGDNQRVKNQQAVLSGVINKVTGSTSILTNYNSILNALEDNFQTSLTQKDMTSLVKMQLKDMSGWTIIQQSVSGSGGMTPVYSIPHMSVYVMYPDEATVTAASQQIQSVMYSK